MRQALAYARVSTQDQADRNLSIPAQVEAIRKFASQNQIEIVQEFADEGVSAFHDVDRPQFQMMMERAKKGINLILVHDQSRFCRDRYASVSYKRILRNYGVSVMSINMPIDVDNPISGFIEAIDEARAESEAKTLAMHTLKGMKQNAQMRDPTTGHTYKNGGRSPYGYRNVSIILGRDSRGKEIRKQMWEVDPQQAEVVRWIFARRLDGWGYKSIASDLNSRKVPTSSGGQWSQSHIREMCYRDRLMGYAGIGVWNKTRDHYKARPESEWIIVPNAHPAIISEEMIPMLAKDHRRSEKPIPRVRDSRFLLTGNNAFGDRLYRVSCEGCEGYMTGVGSRDARWSYYSCSQRLYRKATCDKKYRVPKEEIENIVINEIFQHFGDPSAIRRWAEAAKEVMQLELSEVGERQIALRKERSDLTKGQSNLYQAIENGLPFADVKPRLDEIAKRLKEIDITESSLLQEIPDFDVDSIVANVSVLREELAKGGEDARNVIRHFLASVTWYPDKGDHVREYMFVSGKGGVGSGTYTIPLIVVNEKGHSALTTIYRKI